MAYLRYANIRFKDRHAGVLQETSDGGTEFVYADDFQSDIACAFPRSEDRYPWPNGLHPFFEHLGPEGWLRSRQARTAEIDVEDDFGILLAYGSDCIGAVSVHDPDERRLEIDGARLDPLTYAGVMANRTISGVQPKLLATKDGKKFMPAGATGGAEYIAKFPTDDLPDLVLNEDISLSALRILLGREQVTVAHRAFVEGIPTAALLVSRFDRTATGEKIRLEDFAQILVRPRRRDFSGKYDASFEEAAEVIDRYSARKEIDRLHYFRRILAYALLGNCDSHLKNFSLIETNAGLRLSPAYDVVNSYVYAAQGISTRFGLRLDGEKRQFDSLDRGLLADFARRVGVADKAVIRTFEDFADKRDRVLKLFVVTRNDHSGLLERYRDIVSGAYARILD